MSGKPLSASSAALIWFGASVSVTEIAAGTLFAPLGWERGMLAQILGHIIGGLLFFAAAYIGAATGKSANGERAPVVRAARIGAVFGGQCVAACGLDGGDGVLRRTSERGFGRGLVCGGFVSAVGFGDWCADCGVAAGGGAGDRSSEIMIVAAMLLIMLWLSWKVFGATPAAVAPAGEMSFGTAVELSAAMPLSWLPLAADYTRHSQRPKAAAAASAVSYTLTSCWMYALGLAAALFTGQSDAAQILLGAGLVSAGVFVVVVSTVTTAFLDTYSAGVSANNIWRGFAEIPVAVAVTLVGTLLAVFLTMSEYEGFLLWIASVFAPMAAVLIPTFCDETPRHRP